MFPPPPSMDEWQQRAKSFMDASPLKDFEKNAKVWLESAIAHFNLVQRSEMDSVSLMMEKMATRIELLEARIKSLEDKS